MRRPTHREPAQPRSGRPDRVRVAAIAVIAAGSVVFAASSIATALPRAVAPGGTGPPAAGEPAAGDPDPGEPGGRPHAEPPLAAGEEQRLPATEVAAVYAQGSAEVSAEVAGLAAGDTSGGAVTYLRFEVPETGRVLREARLSLTPAQRPLPGVVELVAVPDTSWQAADLSWQDAPNFGPDVWTARPGGDSRRVTFDLTGWLVGPGSYAFAVTVPADRGQATFVAAGRDRPVLRLTWGAEAAEAVPRPAAQSRPAGAAGCGLLERLVPACGVLWGVAPDGHTGSNRSQALARYEAATGRRQDIYHAYHRADSLFPTAEEVTIAGEGRLLFLNWKPLDWSWAAIAAGEPAVESYLDELAEHIQANFPQPFFFTIHHEPENDVRPWPDSGWEATDYAAMYRHVVQRLRAAGVTNLVTVMDYLAYVPWSAQPWFPDLYPGDDVVDWIAWNSYAYSDPGYGYGDFGELMNRRSTLHPEWPGFYTWATSKFPDKPFMVGEWGVWHSGGNPGHMADFYDSVGRQLPLYPRVKAMVYFDTPSDQRARDSRPAVTDPGLDAFRRLGSLPYFQVQLAPTD